MDKDYLNENISVLSQISKIEDKYLELKNLVINCFNNGHKLLFAGNGGSASDANHIACEFVSRFKLERNSLPAIALSSNEALLTAIPNDYSFDCVFSRQLEGLGNEGDIFIGITTSGKSKNVLKCFEVAKKKNIKTVLITGNNITYDCDCIINIPSNDTSIIQNVYMVLFHMLCHDVEGSAYENRN